MSESGLIGDLIAIIKEQTVIYTDMLELSAQKKDIVIKNNIEGLREITAKENGLIGRSQRFERKRVELLKDIATVLNKPPEMVTMEFALEVIGDRPETQEVKDAVYELRTVLNELKGVNDLNKELIQDSLEYIDYSMNIIRSTVGEGPAFSSLHGDMGGGTGGFFDSLQ